MFTGIIEDLGRVAKIERQGDNIDFTIESNVSKELKIDQSIAHNGVCLTVTSVIDSKFHTVTAIEETLAKSNIGDLQINSIVNLERCMQMNGRLDGHIVQGHVDQTGVVESVTEQDGSWVFTISYDAKSTGNLTVEKGSICINGTSLTVVNSEEDKFSVAIIPYTYEHTCFKTLKRGDRVNLEFDILGKYIKRYLQQTSLL